MAEFLTPTDIGNRALQHVGSELMDATLGFTEQTKRARQVSFCYGKLRRAELERNVWTFATRRAVLRAIDSNTMLLTPALWVASVTYYRGSIVIDDTNTAWISAVQTNLNNQPQNSPDQWEPYFGPLTVSLYDSTTSYMQSELVYTASGNGTYRVYLSLQGSNADTPATATSWSATATYNTANVVTYLSVAYQSLIDLNINQTPTASPAAWASGTTYAAGNQVRGSDNLIYTSIGSGNVGHDPTTTGGVYWTNTGTLCPWTTVFVGGAGSIKWLEIGGAEFATGGVGLTTLNLIYPLGSGPSSQSTTQSVYRLPAGFLRVAPQDPKAGAVSWLGSPGGSLYSDWVYESDYIVTSQADLIVLRFVADVQDVSRMKTMFCEGLACRIAAEVCEPLTQSTAKLASIASFYKTMMGEARTINAIEAGWEEPPIDDYLACRG